MSKKKGKHFDSKKEINQEEKKIKIPFFFIISIIITIICIAYIIKWATESNYNKEVLEKAHESVVVETVNEEPQIVSVDFDNLKETNSETVAWIKVNNTEIDFPVVQAKDNDYYLRHSFDKSYNIAGWIFMDYRVKRDGTDKNTTIYGHNMKNGTMFTSLKNILNEEWYSNEDNLKVTYIDEKGIHLYQVFSIYQIEKETYYTNTDFNSNAEFKNFINTIKGRSKVDFGIEVGIEDQILTLSTCANNNNYRVVLHAKKIEK